MPATTTNLQQDADQLVSEDVQEIISYRPHWIIRRGNFLFLAVLIGGLSLTWFIRYPDVVAGRARLVAVNAPKTLAARKEGKLTHLLTTSGTVVTNGQPLAVVESSANFREVLALQTWLAQCFNEVSDIGFEAILQRTLPAHFQLGELQTAYQQMEREWKEGQQFFGSGYYRQKKTALETDLVFVGRLKQNLVKQTAITRQEQSLQQQELAAYDSLARDRLVAPIEVNKYKVGLLGKEQALVQAEAQAINNDLAAHNKHKELVDLQKHVSDQQQKLITALLTLKAETDAWIRSYIVTAPESGTLFFLASLQVNQQVGAGQELFYVQPKGEGYWAQLMAGQAGLGKVREGQPVRLKVENYPSEEFGYLKGTVRSVSQFPNRQDSFLVEVALTSGLKTVYNKPLFFRNNMTAAAEIITDDRRLLHRFFDPIRKLWQQ